MNDKKIIKDGNAVEGNLICYFKNNNNSKKYCYYILGNQEAGSPTVKVHVAVVKQANESLNEPIVDDEWAFLKGIMGNVVQGKKSEGVTYLIPASDLEVVNEKVIAMPVSYDYVNKHTAEYDASKVADDAPVGGEEAPAAPTANTAPAQAGGEVNPVSLTPDAPSAQASEPAPASAPSPAPNLFDQALNPSGGVTPVAPETNLFDQNPAPAAAPANAVPVTDISGFSNIIPEQDKEVPKVPETPKEPSVAEGNTFSNIIPNPSDLNEPVASIANTPVNSGAPSNMNLNIDEIKNKCTEMINAINAFTEELSKLTESINNAGSITNAPASEPVISSVEPVSVSPSPIQSADVSSSIQPSPGASSFETNWFDTAQ